MLIVETGSGATDSQSYASVADADAYHAARGRTLWATMSEAEKEQALTRATDYMVEVYRKRWDGYRINSTQALDWPRYGVCKDGFAVLSNVVPAEVSKACMELALIAAAGDLLAPQGPQVKSEKVGPLEVVYADGARQATAYPAVDRLLSPLFGAAGGSNTLKVVRA